EPMGTGSGSGTRTAGSPVTAGRPTAGCVRAVPRRPDRAPEPPTSNLGVRVKRLPVEIRRRRLLYERAEIHHADDFGDVAYDREIVGDDEVGELAISLQPGQQVEYLGLDRDVERRHRLVGHDEVGAQDQRSGDADALALAAGELVRVARQRPAWQADRVQ